MTNIQQIIKDSKFISEIKEALFEDCFAQLEGAFGLSKKGVFEAISRLPNIKEGTQDYVTRKELEHFIKRKQESDISPQEAVRDFVREYAFTCVNRFVAFKMMEERKILRQTISREYESNAFKFYLADHKEDEKLWKQGKVYESYAHFIKWQCQELCNDNEIKVLFDADNIISHIFPQERTLKRIFELINQERLSVIWKEDEVIGWVYQYFIEDDKARVFDKIYTQKLKMDLTDIAPATQIFTPKWIVQFLVENTLGRLWIRMHPDTRLKDKMKYYVPNDNDKERIDTKPVREITLLDPACGTMHFGVMAFDIFYEMYLEELAYAGKEGWPKQPSCSEQGKIAASIIENNLYGIDIDLRAVQLSALSLYLKAKTKNKDIRIEKYNLVHTDIPAFSEKAINEFVSSLSSKHDLTKKLFKLVMPELSKAYYLGSLLKIEDIINSFLEEQHKTLFKQFGKQEHLSFMMKEEQREILFKKEAVWPEVKEELRQALNDFIEQANGKVDTFVAQESKKGIYLIDALMKKHDVVVCNPPYSGRRNMNSVLKSDLASLYPKKDGDLYTVFIDRCLNLTAEHGGFCGMVTIHSFMFTSSHEQIRKDIIETTAIESLVHLGTKTEFDVANKTAQGFAMYSLCKNNNEQSNGVHFRLVTENEEEKRLAFENALGKYKSRQKSDKIYILKQEKFKLISGWPFVYWISDRIRNIFSEGINFREFANSLEGLKTGDNFRFIRFWWELGKDNIYCKCKTHEESKRAKLKWYPLTKGGEFCRWFGNLDYIVNWQKDGEEIKRFPKSAASNLIYYFQEGVTYTRLTVSKFCVRYMPAGFIANMAGPPIYPKKIDTVLLLGILNSNTITYLMRFISPTVNYAPGDINNIPIFEDKSTWENIKEIANDCYLLSKKQDGYRETNYDFTLLLNWEKGILGLLEIESSVTIFESKISELTYHLYRLNKEDIDQIENEFGYLPGHLPEVKNLRDEKLDVIKSLYFEKHIPSEALKQNNEEIDSDENEEESEEGQQSSGRRGRSTRYLTLEEVCLASGFHPNTVYEYIKSKGLEREDERFDLAVRYISYALGVVMGRFEVKGINPDDDGITVLDEGHNDDTPARIRAVLNKVLDEKQAQEVIDAVGGDSRRFLLNDFFTKYHIPMYKKRPVYWLLRTAKKNYGFYIYNLKFTKDTLYSLVRKYIVPRVNLEKTKLEDAHKLKEKSGNPKEKREIDKRIGKCEEFIEEIEAFKLDIQEVIDTGFIPDIDDGVILNMAPLYKLIPWKEPQKYYNELIDGKYEWAQVSKYFKQ